jgi:hypothetical protein
MASGHSKSIINLYIQECYGSIFHGVHTNYESIQFTSDSFKAQPQGN